MKYFKYHLLLAIIILGTWATITNAQSPYVFRPLQGGTGIGSATAGDIGNCLKVLTASPFTYELGTCGGGGSGGGDSVFSRTSAGLIYTPTTTDAFLVGGTATSSNSPFYVDTGIRTVFSNGSLVLRSPANGANILQIQDQGGTQRFRIDTTSGNGILWLRDSANNYNISLNSGANSYFNNMNVGIGTTSPYARLSVAGEVVSSYLTATSTTATSSIAGGFSTAINKFSVDKNGNASTTGLRYKTLNQFQFANEGDSLSTGPSFNTRWPYWISSTSPLFSKSNYISDYATAGDKVGQMIQQYDTQGRNYCTNSQIGDQKYYLIWGGINDILAGSTTDQLATGLTTLWDRARADGCIVIASTIMHSTAEDAGEEAVRLAVNQKIGSLADHYDYLVRPDLILDPTVNNSYFEDATHTNAAGAALLAKGFLATIFENPFLAIPGNGTTTDRITKWDAYLPGFLTIGTSTPSAPLTVNGTSTKTSIATFINSSNTPVLNVNNDNTLTVPALANCDTIDSDANGVFSCGTDASGGGSGGGAWSTTTSTVSGEAVVYPNNNTDVVTIGSNATTSAKFFFDPTDNKFIVRTGGMVGINTATPLETFDLRGTYTQRITSNTVDIWKLLDQGGSERIRFDLDGADGSQYLRDSSGTYTVRLDSAGNSYFNGGNVGIGTTSPYAKLSVTGQVVGEYFTATSSTATSTFMGDVLISKTGTATSTQYIYSKTAGYGGQIIMEDEGGGACTIITTKAGVINSAVVTCPPEK